jgi:predicted GTPase
MAEWTSKKQEEAIRGALKDFDRKQHDPHFLVLGATGVGKSSLINRLFKSNQHAVSDVRSTTRSFNTQKYTFSGDNVTLITDSPGYGEVGHDEDYSAQVVTESCTAHAMILVLKADEKGYQRDIDIITRVFANPDFNQHWPFLIALNQIDKLPPIRDWTPPYRLDPPPSPSDTEKVANMKQKIILVGDQFGSIAGREIKASICPVMSEPREGEPFGIQAFRERLFDVLPKAAQLKYARATRIAEEASGELMKKLDGMAHAAIATSATTAGAAVLVNPLPASDWVALVPIQLSMIVAIGAIYGKTITPSTAKETIAALGFGFAARTVFQGVISLLPGVKNVLGPPYAFAATHALGLMAKAYFQTGMTPTKDVIKKAMDEELKRQKEQ